MKEGENTRDSNISGTQVRQRLLNPIILVPLELTFSVPKRVSYARGFGWAWSLHSAIFGLLTSQYDRDSLDSSSSNNQTPCRELPPLRKKM
jgi:hypothetical protein